MSTVTTVPLNEYLKTSYRPDREYVDGELLERNVGEWEHSDLQTAIASYLRQRKNELGIQIVVEQRVQVKPTRFRIPDITVLIGIRPAGAIVTDPRSSVLKSYPLKTASAKCASVSTIT